MGISLFIVTSNDSNTFPISKKLETRPINKAVFVFVFFKCSFQIILLLINSFKDSENWNMPFPKAFSIPIINPYLRLLFQSC